MRLRLSSGLSSQFLRFFPATSQDQAISLQVKSHSCVSRLTVRIRPSSLALRLRTVRRLTQECDLTWREIAWSCEVAGKKRRNCEESPELKRRRISQRQGPPRKSL